jgi:hypothetical protein
MASVSFTAPPQPANDKARKEIIKTFIEDLIFRPKSGVVFYPFRIIKVAKLGVDVKG